MSLLPSLPNASLIDIFQAYPEFSKPIMEFAQALMRGDSPFTEGERELIATFVSSINKCEYCRTSHGAMAEKFGHSKDLVNELLHDIDSANIPDKLKPIFYYIQKLNLTPTHIEQLDIDAILAAGWNEKAVVHAGLICGFFNLMNRLVEGVGIEPDLKILDATVEHRYKHGYLSILEVLDR